MTSSHGTVRPCEIIKTSQLRQDGCVAVEIVMVVMMMMTIVKVHIRYLLCAKNSVNTLHK